VFKPVEIDPAGMVRYRQPSSSSTRQDPDLAVYGRVGVLVAACTAVLTLAFVGVVSLASGEATNLADRVPFYVLGSSIAFVVGVLGLDGPRRDGRNVLLVALAIAGATLLLLSLGVEGLRYTVLAPDAVLVSSSGLYLVAAGVIGTGVGYWAFSHWRELAPAVKSF